MLSDMGLEFMRSIPVLREASGDALALISSL